MVSKECIDKRRKITAAAQKLFAQFGFEKATMQDIANELETSKASLYYYFPDKEALYRAIIEQEKDECLCEIQKTIDYHTNPKTMLSQYAIKRFEMTERLVNLSRMKNLYQQNLQTFMKDAVKDFNKLEDKLIIEILEIGISKGCFRIESIEETGKLFNDLVRGLRMLYLRNRIALKEEERKEHLRQLDLFINIFCQGLSA